MKNTPNFIRVLISSIKILFENYSQTIEHKIVAQTPYIMFSIYYHQAIDLIESKTYKPFASNSKKKPSQNVCSILFKNNDVEFINIACILRDSDIVNSLPAISVKFYMPMPTYKLTPPISTKFFNFNKVVNNLDLN